MLPHIGYTNRYPPDFLHGSAIGRSAALFTRLATGALEGGVVPHRLASTPAIVGGLPHAPQGSPSSHTCIFYVHLQDASRGMQAFGVEHEGFFWRGPQNEESRGMASVPWETLCHPMDQGGLGVRQLMHTNIALLFKWVSRILQPTGELITSVLRDEYGDMLVWQIWQTPKRGDSAFMSSLCPTFQAVQPFFCPRLGSGESIRFLSEDWFGQGSMSLMFPQLFALARDQQ